MKRLLLPLDGSACSKAAIPIAREMAEAWGGELVVMTVGNLPETSDMAREEQSELQKMLDRTLQEFDLKADSRIEMGGDPAQGILRIADDEHADVIVMATHGRSGLTEFAHGSVAPEVVRDGRKPVLLVRPKEGTG